MADVMGVIASCMFAALVAGCGLVPSLRAESPAPPQEPKGFLTPAARAALGVETPANPAGARPTAQQPGGVRFDANGWPITPGLEPVPRRVSSDFDRSVPAPSSLDPARANATPPGPLGEGARSRIETGAEAQPVAASESPLADVFAVIGDPVRVRALAGVRAELIMELLDARGAVVGGAREVMHEADLAVAQRDRMQLPGNLIFGRSERSAFAERAGLPWPALDRQAAEHLDVHGMLLRFPWCFADARVFTVFPAQVVADGEQKSIVIRLERDRRQGQRMGPAEPSAVDRFELWCSPDTMIPNELRFTLGATGAQRRVVFSDWRPVANIGVQMPHTRELRGEDGTPLMELRMRRLDVGLDLPPATFRPR